MNIEVKCPCCNEILVIDTDSGEIIRHHSEKSTPKDFNQFLKDQENRSSELDKKFAEAKEKQSGKMAELEKKFKEGQLKAKENPDAPIKGVQWD